MRRFMLGFTVAGLIVGAAYGGLALAAASSGSYTYTLPNGSTLTLAIAATSNGRTTNRTPQPQTDTFGTPSGQVSVTLTPTYTPPSSSSSSSSSTTSTSTTATATTATSTTSTSSSGSPGVLSPTQPTDVTSWIAPGTFAPAMSDAAAAADVTLTTEAVPANTAANNYVPTAAQIAAFHAATWTQNPLYQYVDGLDGIPNPSTDDLIQWVSHKWGIPTSWIRAQIRQESDWQQSQLGDELSVTPAVYAEYPSAEQAGNDEVWTSMSLAQVKWEYGVSNLPGTGAAELRIESSAFALDIYGATVRYYYDGGPNDWLLATQPAGDQWDSIGDWYDPGPPSSHSSYVSEVQAHLAAQDWPWSAPLS